MKLSKFQQRFDAGSAPDSRTIVSWIKKGYIYGEIYGPKSVYVDPDRTPIKEEEAKNDLVVKVLLKHGAKAKQDESQVA